MRGLARAISKMFVVLVMLFGSPPVVSLRDLVRRPAVVIVTTASPPAPPAPPAPPEQPPERRYLPVKAA